MKQIEDLRAWIESHEKDLEKDIAYLIEVPSISVCGTKGEPYGAACQEVAGRMREIAGRYGFDTDDCEGHCVRVNYGGKGKRVEFWNHLDVVPEGSGWVYPPYKCTRIGDFLIGRGVSDNKGPAMAVLYAMRYLREKGIALSYDLKQVCGLAEEVGMNDAAWYVEAYGSPDLAVVVDCPFPICYGEKGRCEITVRSKSSLKMVGALAAGMVNNSVPGEAVIAVKGAGAESLEVEHPGVFVECGNGSFKIMAKGRAGHAAAPEKCFNPIGILMRVVMESGLFSFSEQEEGIFQFLELACRDGYGEALGVDWKDDVFERLTFAGTVLRLQEGRAILHIDVRFPPSVDMNAWSELLKQKVERFGMEIADISWGEGYQRDLEDPWIKALMEVYREVCGSGKQPYVMGGNTYARFFEKGVGFGPGIAKDYHYLGLPEGHGGGHACDEVQAMSSLLTAIEIYVKAILKLDGILGGER